MPPQAAPASAGITAASPQTPTALPQAATAVPTFDTQGTLGAVRNFYQIPQAAQAAGVEGQGLAGQSDYMNKRNEIQANYAREQAQHEAEASAYRLQNDPNGGPSKLYNIFTGRQVNALEFQQKTGANPSDVYKNSQNKFDQTFAQDYQNYESYMQAKLNPTAGNKAIAQDYEKTHPQLKKMTGDQLRQAFMKTYGAYFGMGNSAPTSAAYAPTYSPSLNNYLTEYQARQMALLGGLGAPSSGQASTGQIPQTSGNSVSSLVKKK